MGDLVALLRISDEPLPNAAADRITELEATLATVARCLPDHSRAIIVDVETGQTIGDLVGRRWDE